MGPNRPTRALLSCISCRQWGHCSVRSMASIGLTNGYGKRRRRCGTAPGIHDKLLRRLGQKLGGVRHAVRPE